MGETHLSRAPLPDVLPVGDQGQVFFRFPSGRCLRELLNRACLDIRRARLPLWTHHLSQRSPVAHLLWGAEPSRRSLLMSTPQAAPPVVREGAEAAAVAAAREEIVRALGPLAASPLTEPAVAADAPGPCPGRFCGRTGRGAPSAAAGHLTVCHRRDAPDARVTRGPGEAAAAGILGDRGLPGAAGPCCGLAGCLVSRVLSLVRHKARDPEQGGGDAAKERPAVASATQQTIANLSVRLASAGLIACLAAGPLAVVIGAVAIAKTTSRAPAAQSTPVDQATDRGPSGGVRYQRVVVAWLTSTREHPQRLTALMPAAQAGVAARRLAFEVANPAVASISRPAGCGR